MNQVTEKWERVPGGFVCRDHGHRFSVAGTCMECMPVDDVDLPPLSSVPEGCTTAVALEAKFLAISATAEKMARIAYGKKPRKDSNFTTSAKLLEVAIKALRAASELTRNREAEEMTTRRMAELQLLLGKAQRN